MAKDIQGSGLTRGIYIHFPFCRKICHYCDFFVDKDVSQVQKYIDTLLREIDMVIASLSERALISSVYFGGGTPSLMTAEQLRSVMGKLNSGFELTADCEISMESNPGSVTKDNLSEYRQAGVNRLSIGIQSFRKRELGFLKRDHSPRKAMEAVNDALETGFSSVSCDLIFALPAQTKDDWKYSLETAISLGTSHISTYSLMYEEGTPLYEDWKAGRLEKADDSVDEELYLHTIGELAKAGLRQYEVSNFSLPGHECRHNLAAWNCGEYFAFGASAHGYVNGIRFSNYRNLPLYYKAVGQEKLPRSGEEKLGGTELMKEALFLPLRAQGLDQAAWGKKFGMDHKDLFSAVNGRMLRAGFIKAEGGHISLTAKGYALCDSVTFEYMKAIDEALSRK